MGRLFVIQTALKPLIANQMLHVTKNNNNVTHPAQLVAGGQFPAGKLGNREAVGSVRLAQCAPGLQAQPRSEYM